MLMFSSSLHLLGLVWSSLRSRSPPLQIYLQPKRDKQYLHKCITSSSLELYILYICKSYNLVDYHAKQRDTATHDAYHISGMVCSQAKVSDLHMVLRVKEDVDRFQVPVNHALKERRMDEEICSVW